MHDIALHCRFSMKTRNRKRSTLTYEQNQMILGTLLGDAGLHRRVRNGFVQYEFYIAHGLAQEQYINYTANILGANVGLYYKGKKSFGPGGGYYRYSYSNKPELEKIYKLCFRNGKKFVSDKWLKEIDELALAYWFMDDGSSSYNTTSRKNKNKNSVVIRFSSQSFTKSEHKLLSKKLLSFGVETIIRKVSDGTGFQLYIKQKSVNRFMDIIEDHILPGMEYKIKRKPIGDI